MLDSDIRRRLEEREAGLSPYAARSASSRGREKPEPPSLIRTAFQLDRDRIVYCKAFRRLNHKTQVFISPAGDHYVTRLTHTLQVSQVARTIARALNLNEDLAEAISLGHDLGHTPFGHAGEEVLADLLAGGFRHNEQSLRVVEVLENEGHGLNLTWEVREGILKHSKGRSSILGQEEERATTLEAQVCRVADLIAYVNHDCEDAVRAGIITGADLPAQSVKVLGRTTPERIDTLVGDVVQSSWSATGLSPAGATAITMSPTVLEATSVLREFLFQRVYEERAAMEETERARRVLRFLFEHFNLFPEKLPPEYSSRHDSPERRVADYIAGMTDRFAAKTAREAGLDADVSEGVS
ncbi:MAG: deoxyguanosinetriphosphate triphosphohydrolase [Dehalococcoidia bacterium]|nr:deoxyguanosinetriphosphate triphosphohydrolase [Dehalococcoidia bacterium]